MPDCRRNPDLVLEEAISRIHYLDSINLDHLREQLEDHLKRLKNGERGYNLNELVDLISSTFLGGSLNAVRCFWMKKLRVPNNGKRMKGLTCMMDYSDGKDIVTILVDDHRVYTPIELMSTIMHESFHAHFDSECCLGWCREPDCRRIHDERIGEGGHGKLWQELAFQAEQLVNVRLGIPVDLEIEHSVETDRYR